MRNGQRRKPFPNGVSRAGFRISACVRAGPGSMSRSSGQFHSGHDATGVVTFRIRVQRRLRPRDRASAPH